MYVGLGEQGEAKSIKVCSASGCHAYARAPCAVLAPAHSSGSNWKVSAALGLQSLGHTGYGERNDNVCIGEHVRKILNRVVSRVQCQAFFLGYPCSLAAISPNSSPRIHPITSCSSPTCRRRPTSSCCPCFSTSKWGFGLGWWIPVFGGHCSG